MRTMLSAHSERKDHSMKLIQSELGIQVFQFSANIKFTINSILMNPAYKSIN